MPRHATVFAEYNACLAQRTRRALRAAIPGLNKFLMNRSGLPFPAPFKMVLVVVKNSALADTLPK
jgi:hypothetical protein